MKANRRSGGRGTLWSRMAIAASLSLFLTALVSIIGPVARADASSSVWPWVHMLGSTTVDKAMGITADATGNTYVTGYTGGSLPGAAESFAGWVDLFVAKYDAAGERQWVHQLGTSNDDVGNAVAFDGLGNLYVTGYTGGTLPGSTDPGDGQRDLFLAKYDVAGNQVWVRQLGASTLAANDGGFRGTTGTGLAVDSAGAVYVTGETTGVLPGVTELKWGKSDSFIAKYDSSGALSWIHQLGFTLTTEGRGVAVDTTGNVYMTGRTSTALPGLIGVYTGADMFLAKYDGAGTKLWVRQLGTSDGRGGMNGAGVAVDGSGHIYVTGMTGGQVPRSVDRYVRDGDVYLAKYDATGTELWARVTGSFFDEEGMAVALDPSGNPYVTGYTNMYPLPRSVEPLVGWKDVFVTKYDASGARLGVHQLGSSKDDLGRAIAVDGHGNVYVAGESLAGIAGSPEPHAGDADMFVAKYTVGIPTSPRIVGVASGNARLTVSFIEPIDHGYSLVTDYTVTCWSKDGELPGSVVGQASPIVVTGLHNGQSYRCKVTATSASGTGRASGPTEWTTPSLTTSTIAGGAHSCALLPESIVECWGLNSSGQVGDGTAVTRKVPVLVAGLSNVRALAAGDSHTCALLSDGTVKCWGQNGAGQLGDGTATNRLTPTSVSGLSGVTAIAAGGSHTCALLSDGTVKCWDQNARGELGDGTTMARSAPVAVAGLSGVSAIAAGRSHTCVLAAGGTAKCWGSNLYGQVGDGTGLDRLSPVTVSGVSGATAVAALGSSTCALTSGAVQCWGLNNHGQLGDGTRHDRRTPVAVVGLSGVTAVAGGSQHVCALLGDGSMKCWGANGAGQLGDGTTEHRSTPVIVRSLTNVRSITAGTSHTVARLDTGALRAWGNNGSGQLGDGAPALIRVAPVPVATFA